MSPFLGDEFASSFRLLGSRTSWPSASEGLYHETVPSGVQSDGNL